MMIADKTNFVKFGGVSNEIKIRPTFVCARNYEILKFFTKKSYYSNFRVLYKVANAFIFKFQ